MDSNHRPLPCQGSALTRLSYGPTGERLFYDFTGGGRFRQRLRGMQNRALSSRRATSCCAEGLRRRAIADRCLRCTERPTILLSTTRLSVVSHRASSTFVPAAQPDPLPRADLLEATPSLDNSSGPALGIDQLFALYLRARMIPFHVSPDCGCFFPR